MDPHRNPFAPGAGAQPPELAGRDEILRDAGTALARVKAGRADRGHMLLGLRGVGKTVLLNRIEQIASDDGYVTAILEAPAEGHLAEQLTPRLRSMLVRLSRLEKAKDRARHALGVLRAFASAFKVSVGDVEFGVQPAAGTADSGSLEVDLPELLVAIGEAAREGGTGAALLIDEVQYLSKEEFGALIVAIHRISQRGLPVIMFGAGLPQIARLAGEAKSYAERLLRYPAVGPLALDAAGAAIRKPVQEEGAEVTDEALQVIVDATEGYPYFLQEWGYHTWNVAASSPITADDVRRATAETLRHLDGDFFKVRLDRLKPREKEYARAMAELGPGPYQSGDVAERLGADVRAVAYLAAALVRNGTIYRTRYGQTAFTVPMFDAFLRRAVPDWAPGSYHNADADGDPSRDANDSEEESAD